MAYCELSLLKPFTFALFSSPKSMAAPCPVKAKGVYLNQLFSKVPKWHLKLSFNELEFILPF